MANLAPGDPAIHADTIHISRQRDPRNANSSTKTKVYLSGINDYDRVSNILEYIRECHKWSIGDFIRNLVITEPAAHSISNNSRWRRVVSLHSALQDQDVMKEISKVPQPFTIGRRLIIQELRAEISKFDQPGSGLGAFNTAVPVPDLKLDLIKQQLQETAPGLCELLQGLMEPYFSSRTEANRDHMGPITMICSIIAFTGAPRKFNQFNYILGIYLHSMGVKRRVMSTLAGLGIIPTYPTIVNRYSELTELGKVSP